MVKWYEDVKYSRNIHLKTFADIAVLSAEVSAPAEPSNEHCRSIWGPVGLGKCVVYNPRVLAMGVLMMV